MYNIKAKSRTHTKRGTGRVHQQGHSLHLVRDVAGTLLRTESRGTAHKTYLKMGKHSACKY